MKIKFMLDEGAFAPESAHDDDAGFDLRATEDKVVPACGAAIFNTGVHIQLEEYTLTEMVEKDGNKWAEPFKIKTSAFIKSKSGLNVKHNITSEGVVDKGFVGSMVVKLYNHGTEDYEVKRGDKISQFVILPILKPTLEKTDKLDDTERGDGGFGSTGR